MASYQYQFLSTDISDIRLLTLLPGSKEDEAVVTIERVPLIESAWPRYEALSYTWGSSEDQVPLCVGAIGNQTISITRNLAEALPYLRLRDRPRVLWIDAVCIDQSNLVERSQQVKKMADIFRNAEKVIVWLGLEDEWSTIALKTTELLSDQIAVDWNFSRMEPASTAAGEDHWADRHKVLPFDWKTWNAIYYFLNRPWFERLWIWQEIRLQSRDAEVLCGRSVVTWQQFRRAIFCLNAKPDVPNIGGILHKRIEHVARLCDIVVFTGLETLITQTQYCKCSDPRDKLYALLGLIDKSEADISIEPDYTQTVGNVYKDVAVQYIKKRRNLEILRYCGKRVKDSGTTTWVPSWAVPTEIRSWDMPSWVPDWSLPRAGRDLPLVYATGGAFAEPEYDGVGALEVTGVALGTVAVLEQILPLYAKHTTSEMLEILERLAPPYIGGGPYIAGGDLGDAFLRTFCCSVFDDTYLPPQSTLPNFERIKEAFVARLMSETPPESIDPALLTYLLFAHEYVVGRSLFRMKEGYIGLAPEDAEVGDQVYLIIGCDTPMVLRADAKKGWRVVGRCYVDGVEDGRIFLGAPPPRYRRVIRFEEVSEKFWPAYLDRQTGEILIEDPRLGPLPPGWRVKKQKEEKAWDWYTDAGIEEDDNPQAELTGDPRWKFDALKLRGLNLQTIMLV